MVVVWHPNRSVMGIADNPERHWRVIAQELAVERDPDRLRALLEEMNCAIRFVRYEEQDDTSSPDASG